MHQQGNYPERVCITATATKCLLETLGAVSLRWAKLSQAGVGVDLELSTLTDTGEVSAWSDLARIDWREMENTYYPLHPLKLAAGSTHPRTQVDGIKPPVGTGGVVD